MNTTRIEPCPGFAIRGQRAIPCGKLPAPDSTLCPKHDLLWRDEQEEQNRRMDKARRGKERKKLMADALASYPLRAENPKFARPSAENATYGR